MIRDGRGFLELGLMGLGLMGLGLMGLGLMGLGLMGLGLMELVLPLLGPERGLLGPGPELLPYPLEVILGSAIGLGGLRGQLRRWLPFGLQLRPFVARRFLAFRCAGKAFRVEIWLDTEDLFIGARTCLRGRLLLQRLPFDPRHRPLVALRQSSVIPRGLKAPG